MSFVIHDLPLNFHSFLGFPHGSGSSVKEIMLLSAVLPLAIDLNFLVCNNIIIISKEPYLDYFSSILKISAYQTSFQKRSVSAYLT